MRPYLETVGDTSKVIINKCKKLTSLKLIVRTMR